MERKMNIMNQKLYHFDNNFYAIESAEKYTNEDEVTKALYKQYAKLKRLQQNPKYRDISFGIGISNQDGKTAIKIEINNGKKGRPLICVKSGKTKDWHIHCVVYGNHASSFCQEFIEYYRKRNSSAIRKHCLANAGKKGADYVPYCYHQCIKWFTHGNFDFSILYNNLTWKEDTLTDNNIFSHNLPASIPEKTLVTPNFSVLKTLYVIFTILLFLIHLQSQNLSIRNIEKFLGRSFGLSSLNFSCLKANLIITPMYRFYYSSIKRRLSIAYCKAIVISSFLECPLFDESSSYFCCNSLSIRIVMVIEESVLVGFFNRTTNSLLISAPPHYKVYLPKYLFEITQQVTQICNTT